MDPKTQADLDNHANQLNPNNEAYHSSRGEEDLDDDDNDDDNDDAAEDFYEDDDQEGFHEEWIPNDAL
jgi:hypothetical protein